MGLGRIEIIGSEYLALLLAVALGTGATGLSRILAVTSGFVARPKGIVPQHVDETPLLGGLGIAIGIAGSLFGLKLMHMTLVEAMPGFQALGLSALGFLIVGTLDDLVDLKPLAKLCCQCTVAAVAVAVGVGASAFGTGRFSPAASLLWLVVVVNAFNLTDVCDGLLATLCFCSMLFLSSPSGQFQLAMATGGSCLGFLVFNRPRATIFLGDGGSHLLGFIAGALTLMVLERNRPNLLLACVQSLLYIGVPIGEMLFLVCVRSCKGIPFWRGSADHFSLRLQGAGLSKSRTVEIAVMGALGLGLLGRLLGLKSRTLRVLAISLLVLSITLTTDWLLRHPVLKTRNGLRSIEGVRT